MIGTILVILSKPEESYKYFQKAVNLDPNNVDAINGIGQSMIASLQYNDAERFLLRVLQIDPNNVPAIHCLGVICENTGRIDEAIKYFEKSV